MAAHWRNQIDIPPRSVTLGKMGAMGSDDSDLASKPPQFTIAEVVSTLRVAFDGVRDRESTLTPDEAFKLASEAFADFTEDRGEFFAPPRSQAERLSLELFKAIEEEKRAFHKATSEDEEVVEFASVGLLPGELAPLYRR
ncbi:hypothetical protein [Botrimarina mediterranea]|uniref:Uncharacterized protein n=1 Tax=Botrimarina mediterranea TaxID=2528022 RepID=A0A518K226_9BACT|nr:hypothetical protein [Botrimarina mediterranea]QDV71864.1 hypothetical protein Spa11_00330 [Botrimarina mediterranea]